MAVQGRWRAAEDAPRRSRMKNCAMTPIYGIMISDGCECVMTRPHKGAYAPHLHSTFELLIALSGHERVQVGRKVVELFPGDLLVLAPNMMHARLTQAPSPVQFCSLEMTIDEAERLGLCGLCAPGFHVRRAVFPDRLCAQLTTAAVRHLGAAAAIALDAFRERLFNQLLRSPDISALNAPSAWPIRADDPDVVRSAWGVSDRYFIDAFRLRFGVTPHQFKLSRRLDRARMALIHSGRPIAEIAVDAGFYDQAHFSNRFKRIYGHSPAAYRDATLLI